MRHTSCCRARRSFSSNNHTGTSRQERQDTAHDSASVPRPFHTSMMTGQTLHWKRHGITRGEMPLFDVERKHGKSTSACKPVKCYVSGPEIVVLQLPHSPAPTSPLRDLWPVACGASTDRPQTGKIVCPSLCWPIPRSRCTRIHACARVRACAHACMRVRSRLGAAGPYYRRARKTAQPTSTRATRDALNVVVSSSSSTACPQQHPQPPFLRHVDSQQQQQQQRIETPLQSRAVCTQTQTATSSRS